MGQARLTRTDAAGEMAAAVDAFRNEATAAIEGLDMEIRRALEWIHHDRREHWEHEVRRGWERITEARVQLQQAMTARRIGNHDPACIDEKKALARAKQRAGDCPAESRSRTALRPGNRPCRGRISGGANAALHVAGIGGPQGPGRLAADDGQPGGLSGTASRRERGAGSREPAANVRLPVAKTGRLRYR